MTQPAPSHSHAHETSPLEKVIVDRNEEHLRLLGLYHLIVAGVNAVGLIIFVVLPLVLGPAYLASVKIPGSSQKLVAALLVGGVDVLIFAMNGFSIRRKQHRVSCLILSCVECLPTYMVPLPFGMILGISAILVLQRESVKALFKAQLPKANI